MEKEGGCLELVADGMAQYQWPALYFVVEECRRHFFLEVV